MVGRFQRAVRALVCSDAGENGAIFHTSCSLKAVSDDPNYDTGETTAYVPVTWPIRW